MSNSAVSVVHGGFCDYTKQEYYRLFYCLFLDVVVNQSSPHQSHQLVRHSDVCKEIEVRSDMDVPGSFNRYAAFSRVYKRMKLLC